MIGAFAGNATGISVTVAAVDATASTFRGVAGRVSAFKAQVAGVGASLRAIALSALPFVTVAAAARSAANAFRDISTLTDRAADAGMAAPALQKLVGAMQQLGVRGASLDTVSRAMQNMVLTTGEVGAEGFAKILGQAARMETETERLDFLAKAFGRTNGAVFASIVRDGGPALQTLIDLASGYPAVTDAAAQAGDRAADAFAHASDTIKSAWTEMLGTLVIGFESTFGPLPDIASAICRAIMIAFKAVTDSVRFLVLTLRSIFEPIFRLGVLAGQTTAYLVKAATDSAYTLRDAFRDIGDAAQDHVRDFADAWKASAEGIFDFSNIGADTETSGLFAGMRNALEKGGVMFRNETTKAIGDFGSAISNSFSKGGTFALQGSNEARKIIMGDPWKGGAAQSQRTVTQYLPRVASGVERMVSRLGDMVSSFDELEAI